MIFISACFDLVTPFRLVDCYASYFGALTCVAWSPDGRFILTGGQDDLITIFSPWEQRVVARCQGHSSFVAGVAFDELRCDGRTYRFGSVGEDNKLILVCISSTYLLLCRLYPSASSGTFPAELYTVQSTRYKNLNSSSLAVTLTWLQATHHQRMSMSSTISLAFRRDKSASYLPASVPPGLENAPSPRYHPAPSRNEVAIVQPVLVCQVSFAAYLDIKQCSTPFRLNT